MIPGKKNMVKTLIILIILTIVPFNVFPRIFANGSGGGYGDGDDGGEGAGINANGLIEYFVIEGAGYYLKAYSDVLLYLNRVELSYDRVDTYEWLYILDRAIYNMNCAISTYQVLILAAEVTGYNEAVIEKLFNFDYEQFLLENNLNSDIFKEVEEYLVNGNITGLYKHILAKFEEIKALLILIRNDVYFNKMPLLKNNWRLNEKCSLTLIFGQYISLVFLSF